VRILVLAPMLLASSIGAAGAQYLVTDDAGNVRGKRPERTAWGATAVSTRSLPPACGPFATARSGEPVRGGGTLNPIDGMVSLNASGNEAFGAWVIGSPRNQGVFVKDGPDLLNIAIGCGGYLGSGDPGTACGDPSPIGGTFTGFWPGLAPSINDRGDVLFLADVVGGSAPRGLFLYRKETATIEKVAAIGDQTPFGILRGVGIGSLNNNGDVAFLASRGLANEETAVFRWKDGVASVVVAPGDHIPGGTVHSLDWFGWLPPDGSYVPQAEIPDINDAGAISFHALLEGGGVGLYVSRDGVHEPYVLTGQASPAGGAYFNLYGASLNEAGEIAFVGEYEVDPWLIGWFVGGPGKWRKVLSFYDRVIGGRVWGLAASHNPAQPLDDEGNLVVWTDVRMDDGSDVYAVHIGYADGRLETLAREGEITPIGGTFRSFSALPTLKGRSCVIGAYVSGGSSYVANFEYLKRPMQVTDLSIGAPDPDQGDLGITWTPQPSPADGSLRHDLLRGRLSGFTQPAECAVKDLPATAWTEPQKDCFAPPGDGCWYLVRAEDTCGSGPYGSWKTVCVDSCNGGPVPGCPVCGNGTIEDGEECDGDDLAGETCPHLGYDGGSLLCTECKLDTSSCTTICGDGLIHGDEQCDGTNLNARRCDTVGFDEGILACGPECAYDVSGCCCTDGRPGCPVCPVCGNGVREPPFEMCDGADLGGQTCYSQGWPPGDLGCNAQCTAFTYGGCIGF
jgi:hypothetical protein